MKPNNENGCNGFRDALALYHYGELDASDAAELKAHLDSCADCREELSKVVSTLEAVPAWQPMHWETSKAVAGVMSAIKPSPKSLFMRFIPAYAAAAAVVVVMLFSAYMPSIITKAPQETAIAQNDWEVLDNYDVIRDLDVIEELHNLDGFEEQL